MLAELPVKSGLRSYGGLQRIVSERRFYIHVDDKLNPADPWVAIEVKGMPGVSASIAQMSQGTMPGRRCFRKIRNS